MINRECLNCKKPFLVYPADIRKGGGKYCSQKCFFARNSKQKERKCLICGKKFCVNQLQDIGKFCSYKCMGISNTTKVIRNCLVCNKEFWAIPSNIKNGKDKFCSKKCYLVYHSSKKWSTRECVYCHKIFTYRTKQKDRSCCSLSCASQYGLDKYQKKKYIINKCLICFKEIKVPPNRIRDKKGKFCSKKCYTDWQRMYPICDEKSPSWRGGITPLYKKIRSSRTYRRWQKDVIERDSFKCVWCQSVIKIEVDHIKSFDEIIKQYHITTVKESLDCKELWNINNGRTLCHICHKKTDTYGYTKEHYLYSKLHTQSVYSVFHELGIPPRP